MSRLALCKIQSSGDISSELAKKIIQDILSKNILCSIATVNPDNSPHISNAFFAYNKKLQLIVGTHTTSRHVQNLQKHPKVAISITDSHQLPTGKKCGVQLEGTMRLSSGIESIVCIFVFLKRYARGMIKHMSRESMRSQSGGKFYIVDVDKITVFDEKHFGSETYVSKVSR